MIISNLKPHMVVAAPECASYTHGCLWGGTPALATRPPARPPGMPDRPSRPPDKGQTGVAWPSMVNLTYLVHVGCHLDRHIVVQAGADM
jgi:hypothetical protein